MKIDVFENVCEKWGGYYECIISDDNRYMSVIWRSGNYIMFPEDLSKIKSKVKKAGFKLQYIVHKCDGIGLSFFKH